MMACTPFRKHAFHRAFTIAGYVTEQSDPVWQTRLGELSGQHPDRLFPLRRTNLLMGKIWYALNGGHWAAVQELFYDYLRTAETAGDIRIYDAAGQFLGPHADPGLKSLALERMRQVDPR